MNFTDKLFAELGLMDCCPLGFRAVFYGQTTAYFENIKGIKSYSEEEIRLYLKRKELVIRGSGLAIAKYCLTDVTVTGVITGFSVE